MRAWIQEIQGSVYLTFQGFPHHGWRCRSVNGYSREKYRFTQRKDGEKVTVGDAEVAMDILGPNLGSPKGKMAKRGNPHVKAGIDPVSRQILQLCYNIKLTIDIMIVNKISF